MSPEKKTMTGRWNTQRGERRTFDPDAQSVAAALATTVEGRSSRVAIKRHETGQLPDKAAGVVAELGVRFFKNSKKRKNVR
jgi:hypothetical protein